MLKKHVVIELLNCSPGKRVFFGGSKFQHNSWNVVVTRSVPENGLDVYNDTIIILYCYTTISFEFPLKNLTYLRINLMYTNFYQR